MSTTAETMERIYNGSGGKVIRHGSAKRLHSAWIVFEGVDLEIEYEVDGNYNAATSTDPEDRPMCIPVLIKHNGGDIYKLLDENTVSEISQRVEASWWR
jgi:hypothetical protein